jgi:hypothetical protein
MAGERPDWKTLTEKFSTRLVDTLRRHFGGGPFRIRAAQLGSEADVDTHNATLLLEEVACLGVLSRETEYNCPCEQAQTLTEEQAQENVCAVCHRAFGVDIEGQPAPVALYLYQGPVTRDVRWMLALHGMNTTGAWQETFNWLVSRSYGRSLPVAIYKYGIVRPGAIIKFRQRALMRDLQARIRRLSGETSESGFGSVPDVIAHSYGTWLLGHALRDDRTLRVGRVILTGCILRPDFDWSFLIGRGQVRAVLCHTADRDYWAWIAHYVIPGSGPSGWRGFNDREHIGHAVLSGGLHSDFFKDDQLPVLFQNVWEPFLTAPEGAPVLNTTTLPPPNWKQSWWPFRATLSRVSILVLAVVIVVAIAAALVLGSLELWRWLWAQQFNWLGLP